MSNRYPYPIAGFYQGRILNIAHRGAREAAPENTLPAFIMAADLGADGIELDVQLSADKQVVVIHDFTVDKTTDGSGKVAEKSLAELRELDAGKHFSGEFAETRIPTLAEVFEAVGTRLLVNVELKAFDVLSKETNQQLVNLVVQTIRRHEMVKRVICSSFNPFILRTMRRAAPDIPVGYLYAPDMPLPLAKGWLARPVIGRHEARHPHHSMVDKAYIHWARRHHYRVNTWTVNEIADIRRMCNLGVDAIISDRPALVQDILQGEL